MTITRITGIMASDPQGVIGNDSGMLWNYPNEIQYFKQITSDGGVCEQRQVSQN